MLIVQVLLAAAALLLVVAGVTKLRMPHPAVRAARAMGLPGSAAAVRLLAVVEIAVGVGALVSASSFVRVALGVLYGAFLVFVIAAIARNAPITSCGCFGSNDSPPSLVHVAINATGTAVAFVAAADGIESPIDAMAGSALDAIVIVVGAAVLTVLGTAVLSGRFGSSRPDVPRWQQRR